MNPEAVALITAGAGVLALLYLRRPETVYPAEVLPDDPGGESGGPFAPAPEWRPAPGRISPAECARLIAELNDGWHDPRDVLAFVAVESGFNPNAYRFEPRLGEASYGLMQTLESTARDLGFTGPAEQLFDPATSLTFGMRYLRWSWDLLRQRLGRDPDPSEWVAAYNAGVGGVLRGNLVPSYVAKWMRARGAMA